MTASIGVTTTGRIEPGLLLIMSVVNVRIMRMAVTHLFVPVYMAVRFREQFPFPMVQMMLVVGVTVLMLEHIVRMLVLMSFS